MKIISGSLRGTVIPTVKNAKYRPTTGKFKEALFSILSSGNFAENQGFIDKDVLDLFSGSCSIGFEALSRGAGHVTFVDIDRNNLQIAKNFAIKNNLGSKVTFINSDVTQLKNSKKKYDIIFIDPPYDEGLVDKSLSILHEYSWLNPNSYIIIEMGQYEKINIEKHYEIFLERKYGTSKMVILNYKQSNNRI